MKNKLLNFLNYFDYFGVQISFRKSSKEDNFTTSLGGSIFLIFFILSVIYFIINFIPFCLRQNINLILFDKSEVPNRKLNFSELNLNIGFNIIYDNNTVLQADIQKLFNIRARYRVYNKNNSLTKNINLKKCEYSDFINAIDYDHEIMKDFYCFDSKNLTVSGSFAFQPYEFLQIDVELNKNVLIENPEIYENFFSKENIYFNIKYMDTAIDVENTTSPLKNYIESYITYVDYWILRKINLNYNSLELWNDENILFNEFTLNKSFKMESFDDLSKYFPNRKAANQSIELLKIYIKSSANVIIYRRTFQKFTEYLANTSTIISQILLVLFIITSYINSFFSKQEIMNKILNFKDYIVETNKINLDLIKKEIMVNNQNSNISNISNDKLKNDEILTINRQKDKKVINLEYDKESLNDVPIIDENSDKSDKGRIIISDRNNKESKPIDFNICEIILRIFNCGRKLKLKNVLYEKSSDKINHYMSVFKYIRTVQSLEILKYCLLNKEQISLFNFISKPSVSFTDVDEHINNQIDEDDNNKVSLGYINSLIRDYKVIKNNSSGLNDKLMELFKYEIEKFLY